MRFFPFGALGAAGITPCRRGRAPPCAPRSPRAGRSARPFPHCPGRRWRRSCGAPERTPATAPRGACAGFRALPRGSRARSPLAAASGRLGRPRCPEPSARPRAARDGALTPARPCPSSSPSSSRRPASASRQDLPEGTGAEAWCTGSAAAPRAERGHPLWDVPGGCPASPSGSPFRRGRCRPASGWPTSTPAPSPSPAPIRPRRVAASAQRGLTVSHLACPPAGRGGAARCVLAGARGRPAAPRRPDHPRYRRRPGGREPVVQPCRFSVFRRPVHIETFIHATCLTSAELRAPVKSRKWKVESGIEEAAPPRRLGPPRRKRSARRERELAPSSHRRSA